MPVTARSMTAEEQVWLRPGALIHAFASCMHLIMYACASALHMKHRYSGTAQAQRTQWWGKQGLLFSEKRSGRRKKNENCRVAP